MASPQITFRLTGTLSDEVKAREGMLGLTATAKRDLERYYWLINSSTPSLNGREAALLYDALLGFAGHPHSIPYIWAEVAEKIRVESLDKRWGVDGAALIDRVRDMSLCERLRILDIVEQAGFASDYLDFESADRAWKVIIDSRLVQRHMRRPVPVVES